MSLALMVKQESWPPGGHIHSHSLLCLGSSLSVWCKLLLLYFAYSERESGSSASACWRLKDKCEKVCTAGIKDSHDPSHSDCGYVLYVPSGSLYGLTHNLWYRTCAIPLQTLVGLLKHDVIPMSWETLATLSDRCRDPAVSVKKKALQCVGELLAVSLERKCESLFKNKCNINHFCLG